MSGMSAHPLKFSNPLLISLNLWFWDSLAVIDTPQVGDVKLTTILVLQLIHQDYLASNG